MGRFVSYARTRFPCGVLLFQFNFTISNLTILGAHEPLSTSARYACEYLTPFLSVKKTSPLNVCPPSAFSFTLVKVHESYFNGSTSSYIGARYESSFSTIRFTRSVSLSFSGVSPPFDVGFFSPQETAGKTTHTLNTAHRKSAITFFSLFKIYLRRSSFPPRPLSKGTRARNVL